MEGLHYGSLVGIAVAMAIAAGIPAFFPRLVVPAVVLEIVMGVILGPQVLHVFKGGPIANLLYTLGLAMLFLIAGYEVNPAILRGHPIVKAALGWVVSVAIAFAAAFVLVRSGGAIAVCLTALALSTTTLGALMPILRDENLLSPPYGQFVLAAGAIGEVGPIVALTFALAGHESTIARAATLIVFAAAATAAIVTLSFAHSKAFERVVARSIATSGQFPVRLASAILIVLVALTAQLNMDVVLGAFVAGMLLRALIPAEHHESVAVRLDGLGFAFLVPMFFIISGSRLDVAGLMSSWSSLAMVPIYALVMLVARG
ncbi:MAG: cation:proton antiporter, partial [Candidatus Eremiobacteraeota bacterium]|nr:cation:proton antiporter [Candidatus Eremiobacteraeota bacterium]